MNYPRKREDFPWYKPKTIRDKIRDFLVGIHIFLIRLVALNRQLIIGVHFIGGFTLAKDTKRLYMAHCHLEDPDMEVEK